MRERGSHSVLQEKKEVFDVNSYGKSDDRPRRTAHHRLRIPRKEKGNWPREGEIQSLSFEEEEESRQRAAISGVEGRGGWGKS